LYREEGPLTRDEVLAAYRQIRAAIQRVLREAARTCSRADLTRAAKQLGLWEEGRIVADEDALDMLVDVALFEPNQRGRRAFDRFLADEALRLAPADLDPAQRMAGAFFSIFRFAARHETAGVWLEDLLEGDRRLWLVDEGLEASAPDGTVFGMRLFDAGPFHAGFGIVAPVDGETVEFCLEARARGARLPFRHSLAVTLYGTASGPECRTNACSTPCSSCCRRAWPCRTTPTIPRSVPLGRHRGASGNGPLRSPPRAAKRPLS
jgi:hypothetical protein